MFNRQYVQKKPLFTLLPKSLTFFNLSYYTVITVTGPDPLAFLQGQMTCDTRKVTEDSPLLGAFCHLEGRIISLATLFIKQQNIHLVLPKDLWPTLLNTLKKPALFSNIQFYEHQALSVFGQYHPENNELSLDLLTIDDAFKIDPEIIHDEYHWHALCVSQKKVELYPETSGHFLPHQLLLNKAPVVDFEKGCYKGQEIIARVHYRSKQQYQLQVHPFKQLDECTSLDLDWIDYAWLDENQGIALYTEKIA